LILPGEIRDCLINGNRPLVCRKCLRKRNINASNAASAGNLLASGALTVSKSITSGDTPKFPTGDFDVSLD